MTSHIALTPRDSADLGEYTLCGYYGVTTPVRSWSTCKACRRYSPRPLRRLPNGCYPGCRKYGCVRTTHKPNPSLHRSDGANPLACTQLSADSPSPAPTGGMILLTGEGLVSGQHARGISGAPLAETYAAQGPGNAPADEASSAAIATLANPGRDRAAVHLSRQSAVTARYSRASLSALPATATLTDRALTPGHRCPAPGVVQVWGGGLSPVSESRAR